MPLIYDFLICLPLPDFCPGERWKAVAVNARFEAREGREPQPWQLRKQGCSPGGQGAAELRGREVQAQGTQHLTLRPNWHLLWGLFATEEELHYVPRILFTKAERGTTWRCIWFGEMVPMSFTTESQGSPKLSFKSMMEGSTTAYHSLGESVIHDEDDWITAVGEGGGGAATAKGHWVFNTNTVGRAFSHTLSFYSHSKPQRRKLLSLLLYRQEKQGSEKCSNHLKGA